MSLFALYVFPQPLVQGLEVDTQRGKMTCVDMADPELDWVCEPTFELDLPGPFASVARAWL